MKVFQEITNLANEQLRRCGCSKVSEAQALAVLEAYRNHRDGYVDLHVDVDCGHPGGDKDCAEGRHQWKEVLVDGENGCSDMECVTCGFAKTIFM